MTNDWTVWGTPICVAALYNDQSTCRHCDGNLNSGTLDIADKKVV